ncbi:MerR family transcriptional regulator [Streptomyces sp. NPDC057702]|uniref:MerR family transcriptional regulator n=1 Tax=unclassified Streptomyces TaxID=2593676 RepID=UPI00369CBC22
MRMSQLGARSGVPASTPRFHGGAGPLPVDRLPAGYRLYAEDAVDRLAFIGPAKRPGLPRGAAPVGTRGGTDPRPRVAARVADAPARAADLAARTPPGGALWPTLDAVRRRPVDGAYG